METNVERKPDLRTELIAGVTTFYALALVSTGLLVISRFA